MIYDCFTFAGEFDVLALRLETLSDIVDRFVVAEGTRTFAGAARDVSALHERVPGRFRHRIDHLVIDELEPSPASAWANEFRQRNALARGLANAAPDDWILLSDVDEIPHPECISQFRPSRYLSARLHQRVFYYAFNNELVHSGERWELPCKAARITTVRHLRRFYRTLQNLRRIGSEGRLPVTARRIDALVLDRLLTQQITRGGWHFSYVMEPAAIAQKIAAFSHQELNQDRFTDIEHLTTCIRSGLDLFGRDRRFRAITVENDLPGPIARDPERFRKWLVPCEPSAPAQRPDLVGSSSQMAADPLVGRLPHQAE